MLLDYLETLFNKTTSDLLCYTLDTTNFQCVFVQTLTMKTLCRTGENNKFRVILLCALRLI